MRKNYNNLNKNFLTHYIKDKTTLIWILSIFDKIFSNVIIIKVLKNILSLFIII